MSLGPELAQREEPCTCKPFPEGEPEELPVPLNHLDVEEGILQVDRDEPVPFLDLGKNALERQHPEFPFVEGLIQSAQI